MTVTAQQAADRLTEAAQALRAHGWCRGVTRQLSGELCAEGAVLYRDDMNPRALLRTGVPVEVLNADEIADAATTAFAAYLQRHAADLGMPEALVGTSGFLFAMDVVTEWNDGYALDARDVIATLEKAAAWVAELGELPEVERGDNA